MILKKKKKKQNQTKSKPAFVFQEFVISCPDRPAARLHVELGDPADQGPHWQRVMLVAWSSGLAVGSPGRAAPPQGPEAEPGLPAATA